MINTMTSEYKQMSDKERILNALADCYALAATSPDTSNQNAAIIVSPFYDICIGYACNKFPPNIEVTPELLADRDKKLMYIEHAERGSIYDVLARGNTMPENAIMYCPWVACDSCARAVVLSGIKKVVCHRERMEMTPERWKASVQIGLDIMTSHGVEIVYFEGRIDRAPEIIVNGELWKP